MTNTEKSEITPYTPRRRLLRARSVCGAVELSRPQIYKLVAAGTFPPPIKVGAASLWPSDAIEAWIDARIAERDAAIAARVQEAREVSHAR